MILRILAKTLILLAAFNFLFMLLQPMPLLGHISAYNVIFPGRERLPYGDDPEHSFNLSLTQLDAMFASHIISGEHKSNDEYRVILIGDSSTWGFLLSPEQTLAEQLNRLNLHAADGRRVKVYNIGYPTMTLTKDLLFLERSLRYKPDLIIWLFTLESMPWQKQLDSPILELNPGITLDLIAKNDLPLPTQELKASLGSLLSDTIFGQRRALADWVRFQLYGILWAATSVDHVIPETYNLRMEDLPADPEFQGFGPDEMVASDLAFSVIDAGLEAADGVPVLLVNEPMFISQGLNSDLRYNFYYPRWAYDLYRRAIHTQAQIEGWQLVDLWDELPADVFTDSAIHYSPLGAERLAQLLKPYILGR
ncbi:MAG: hypothetical protein P8X64_09510 [Anaerolineales bacterium]